MGRRNDVVPRGADDTAITVWLSPEDRQALRMLAAGAGLATASFVRRLLERLVRAEADPKTAHPVATTEGRNPRKSRRQA
jgi:hypothetical protein